VRDPERASPGVPRHVRVLRRFLGLEPFYHHGVDLGDGRVAHYCKSADIGGGIIGQAMSSGSLCEGAQIRITSMERFQRHAEGPVEEVMHDDAADPAQVLERVMNLCGKRGYNLVFSNCEHFSNFCMSGEYHSRQVDEIIEALDAVRRRAACAATEALFSRPEDAGGDAPFLHARPGWPQMVVSQALDAASLSMKYVLDTVQQSAKDAARQVVEGKSVRTGRQPHGPAGAGQGEDDPGQCGAGTNAAGHGCERLRCGGSACCPCCDVLDLNGAGGDFTMQQRGVPADTAGVQSWWDAGVAACSVASSAARSVYYMVATEGCADTPARAQQYVVPPCDDHHENKPPTGL